MMEMKLSALAERAGVPARTIRLYITQGLLPKPLRAGRDAAYGEEHLTRLQQIRAMQREGLTLAEIHLRLADVAQQQVAARESWVAYAIAPDIMVMVRSNISPGRLARIHAAVDDMASHLGRIDYRKVEDNDTNC